MAVCLTDWFVNHCQLQAPVRKKALLPNCWYVCLSAYFNFFNKSYPAHTDMHKDCTTKPIKGDLEVMSQPFQIISRSLSGAAGPQTLWYTSSENELLSVKGKALWDQLLLWRCMAVLSDVSTLCLNHTRPCAESSCILNHPLGNCNFSLDLLEGFLGNSFLKKRHQKEETHLYIWRFHPPIPIP